MSDVYAGTIGIFGIFIFDPATIFGGVADNLGFFNIFKFFDKAFIGGNFHLISLFTKKIFLLDTGENIANAVIEDECAGEINHDHKHHKWHNEGHLASHGLAEIGLVGLLTIGGFTHKLAESFAILGFLRW